MKSSQLFILALACAGGVSFVLSSAPADSQSAGSFVALQSSSPGTAQSGNVNVTGRVLAGRVGIGTSSPASLLHVLGGNVYIENGFGGTPTVNLAVGDTDTGLNSAGDGLLDIYSNNIKTLSARSGKVGIGTSSPTSMLQVAGGVSSVGIFAGDLNPFGSAAIQTNLSSSVTHAWFAENGGRVASITGGGAGYFAGNLGVGTTAPGARIESVTAAGRAGAFTSTDTNAGAVDSLQGYANSGNGAGVYATNRSATGTTQGLYADVASPGGLSVWGNQPVASNTGYGVAGSNGSGTGWAVFALGRFGASGTKSFVIDHPLDPENKMLLHYSSESPEPENFYNGIVRTDERGYATITLPDYFESINRDPRYTLTVIDEADSDSFVMAKVVQKVRNGQFVIRTSVPNVEVSWEIKAIRNDRWVQEKGAPTEVEKVGYQKGRYLMPSLYGQPESRGMLYRAPSKSPIANRK